MTELPAFSIPLPDDLVNDRLWRHVIATTTDYAVADRAGDLTGFAVQYRGQGIGIVDSMVEAFILIHRHEQGKRGRALPCPYQLPLERPKVTA